MMTSDKQPTSERLETQTETTLGAEINEKVKEQKDLKPGDKKESK